METPSLMEKGTVLESFHIELMRQDVVANVRFILESFITAYDRMSKHMANHHGVGCGVRGGVVDKMAIAAYENCLQQIVGFWHGGEMYDDAKSLLESEEWDDFETMLVGLIDNCDGDISSESLNWVRNLDSAWVTLGPAYLRAFKGELDRNDILRRARLALGDWYYLRQLYKKALEEYEDYLRDRLRSRTTHLLVAQLHCQHHQHKKACVLYRAFIEGLQSHSQD